MKSASISDLKKELKTCSPTALLEACMRLAKYKKDNKELLNYLLFEAGDEQTYINALKIEIDELFAEMNESNGYLVKKGLRKILRTVAKHIHYSGIPQTEIELLIYFCEKIKTTSLIDYVNTNKVLYNLYSQQLKKINKALQKLHEDLQFDYQKALDGIAL